MKYSAVIDTNVLVSALLSRHSDGATVQLLERIFNGNLVPVYSDAIIQEYWEVLNREKFGFTQEKIKFVLEAILKFGISVDPTPTEEQLPDMKDLPFYEVAMEKSSESTYLVTGNLKHFPHRTYIITARQMLDILDQKDISVFRGESAEEFN